MPAFKQTWQLIAAITIFGMVLRVLYFVGRSYVGDEIGTLFYLKFSYQYLLTHFATWLTMNYYIAILKVITESTGNISCGLVGLSLIPGVLTIPLVWILSRRYFSNDVAVISAFLIAVNPVLISFSSILRSYSLLTFLVVSYFVVLSNYCEAPNRSKAFFLSVFAVFMVLSQPIGIYPYIFGFLVLTYQILIAKLPLNIRRTYLLGIAFLILGAVVIFICYTPILQAMIKEGERWKVSGLTDWSYIPYVLEEYFGEKLLAIPSILMLITSLVIILGKTQGNALRFVVFVFLPMVGMSIQGLSHFPWAFGRFLVFILPVLIILVSFGIVGFFSNRRKNNSKSQLTSLFIMGVICASWMPGLMTEYQNKQILQWQQTGNFLSPSLNDENVLLGMSWTESFHLSPYLAWININNYSSYEITASTLGQLNKRQLIRVFFVTSQGVPITSSQKIDYFGDIQVLEYSGSDIKEIVVEMRHDLISSIDDRRSYGPQYAPIYKAIWETGEFLGISLNQNYYLSMWQKNEALTDRQFYMPKGLLLWDIKNSLKSVNAP